METGQVAKTLRGDKLYQQRARIAMPLLVRQAEAGSPIFYGDLAAEIGMPNARNLNYVLGSVGNTIVALAKKWNERIPPLSCIVINQSTRLPSNGVGWFLANKEAFKKLPRTQQRKIVNVELSKIYAFPKWREVLDESGLEPVETDYDSVIKKAARYRAGGESKAHRQLKEYVAANPHLVGLPATCIAQTEYPLPSGDRVDVLFKKKSLWVAVEVKAKHSPEADVTRGLFQCVKYRAVIEALQATTGRQQNARAILLLEDSLPARLNRLKNELGAELVENVVPE